MSTIKSKSKVIPNEIDTQDNAPVTANVAPVAVDTSPMRRNLTGKKEIFTDLFKLMVSKVVKYEGWDEANEHPESHPNKFSTWEHTHPFRTYDKKGDKMSTCTPIGGHFHIVEWETSGREDGVPVIKSVSGPMVMQRQKVRGLLKMVPVPCNDYDDHKHDVEYLRSSKIEFSTTNVQAAQVIAYESSKTAGLPGVEVR
jgi:hypothetical protein